MDRVNRACKFDEYAIARRLDHAPMMSGDCRIDEDLAMALEGLQGRLLVEPHKPAIAGHVGSQDGS